MPEELLEFDNTVEDPDGRSWVATVMAAERDGRWIGWIRFDDPDGESLETERETTQPNRAGLRYWATGLTYFYLEGALGRARRRSDPAPAAAPAATTADRATTDPGEPSEERAAPGRPAPDRSVTPPERGVPRLEVRSASERIAETVMGARDIRPGTAREVPDAGVVVYEGSVEDDAGPARHLFSVQYGSENAAALLANWLWSRLHGAGADVRIDGAPVELTNDALKRALTHR